MRRTVLQFPVAAAAGPTATPQAEETPTHRALKMRRAPSQPPMIDAGHCTVAAQSASNGELLGRLKDARARCHALTAQLALSRIRARTLLAESRDARGGTTTSQSSRSA